MSHATRIAELGIKLTCRATFSLNASDTSVRLATCCDTFSRSSIYAEMKTGLDRKLQ